MYGLTKDLEEIINKDIEEAYEVLRGQKVTKKKIKEAYKRYTTSPVMNAISTIINGLAQLQLEPVSDKWLIDKTYDLIQDHC